MRNTGNVNLGATQIVKLSGLFGGIGSVPTMPKIPELLPGSSASFTVNVRNVWPEFLLTGKVTVTPVGLPNSVLPATMKATSASTTVWAIPWALIILILILGIGGYLLRGYRLELRRGASPATASLGAVNGVNRYSQANSVRTNPPLRARLKAHARECSARLVAAAIASVSFALPSAAVAAPAVPWTDANAVGYIGFCDSSNHQIRSGSITSYPHSVAKAISSDGGWRPATASPTAARCCTPTSRSSTSIPATGAES